MPTIICCCQSPSAACISATSSSSLFIAPSVQNTVLHSQVGWNVTEPAIDRMWFLVYRSLNRCFYSQNRSESTINGEIASMDDWILSISGIGEVIVYRF